MHGHFEVFVTSIYPSVQKHTHAVCIMQTNDHLFSKIFNPAPGPGKYTGLINVMLRKYS